ncbi:LysR family transcriptional regulator [Vibrio sp. MA64]|uniref:LysR family transcriptional regulator n=1 Tax=Vibrio sp. MA64 TaxID=2896365 RepID=UPI001E49D9EE|nr:LysR family transcriptional regulator [Vibrio sp. MA64]ELA6589019.1 LysR family transcriptional regulator [Vibrio alginolyticus]MCC9650214.1 LysR family transcriptional regulator [Vibrio sp. MA64]
MLTKSNELEILISVVDSGGFSAAANSLGIQVARVSRAVSKIESQLGITLLNRTTRRVEVTEEGLQFVEAVRVGLNQIQEAEEDIITRGEQPKGRLRVDAASPFVLHQLVPLIKPFKEAYPGIQLDLTSNEGFVDLLENRTDIAIRVGQLADSTLHAKPLGTSPLFIVASPNYLSRKGLPKSVVDLKKHCLIGFSTPKILNEWPLRGFNIGKPDLVSSSGETIRKLALEGNGIACLSGFMVKNDLDSGQLISLLESEKTVSTAREQVNAVFYKSSSLSKRITAFVDFIQPRLKLR